MEDVGLSRCLVQYRGSHLYYVVFAGVQYLQVSPLLCSSPEVCIQYETPAWDRWLQNGQGRCFQAHNFSGLSNDSAVFIHLLPQMVQALFRYQSCVADTALLIGSGCSGFELRHPTALQ